MAEIAIPIFSGLARVMLAIAGSRASLERDRRSVVDDLRVFRFDDDGILPAIDALLAGIRPDEAWVSQRLRDFNDSEWLVAEAAARLSSDVDRLPGISRMMSRELELIRFRKIDIRSTVQNLINPYFQPGHRINRSRMKKLRLGITELNDAIDKAEHILLHGI